MDGREGEDERQQEAVPASQKAVQLERYCTAQQLTIRHASSYKTPRRYSAYLMKGPTGSALMRPC